MENKIKEFRRRLQEGESSIAQGKNEIVVTGEGHNTYLWIGGNGCYGTLSGQKTLVNLAVAILKATKHEGKIKHLVNE